MSLTYLTPTQDKGLLSLLSGNKDRKPLSHGADKWRFVMRAIIVLGIKHDGEKEDTCPKKQIALAARQNGGFGPIILSTGELAVAGRLTEV